MIVYCATILDNSFAETKELLKESLIEMNILNKSYTRNVHLFQFVNTYDVICSSLYRSISSMKEYRKTCNSSERDIIKPSGFPASRILVLLVSASCTITICTGGIQWMAIELNLRASLCQNMIRAQRKRTELGSPLRYISAGFPMGEKPEKKGKGVPFRHCWA